MGAAFYAGLRRGELQALRVCDVDLGASLIHVERGWDQEEGAIDPKSEASRRTVPLLAVLRDHLDEHLLRTGRTGEELVFGRTSADPFVPSSARQPRAGVLGGGGARADHAARGAAHLRLAADRLRRATPKAIQEFMGHSKIQTTFDTYGHLLPG